MTLSPCPWGSRDASPEVPEDPNPPNPRNLQAAGRLQQRWGTEGIRWGQKGHTWDKGQWVWTPRWDPVWSPHYRGLVTKLLSVTSPAPVTGGPGRGHAETNPAWEGRGDRRSSRSTRGYCVTSTRVVLRCSCSCAQGCHHHQVVVDCVPVSPHRRGSTPMSPMRPSTLPAGAATRSDSGNVS